MASIQTADSGKGVPATSNFSLVQRVSQPNSRLTTKDLDYIMFVGIRNYASSDTISMALAYMCFSIVAKNAEKDSGNSRQAHQYLEEMPAQLGQYGPSNN